MTQHIKQAHEIMVRRIVEESTDPPDLFDSAIRTLVEETSMHCIMEALLQIARTRMWTDDMVGGGYLAAREGLGSTNMSWRCRRLSAT
jgi:hypothetical protein